jgi:hypothetical protein
MAMQPEKPSGFFGNSATFTKVEGSWIIYDPPIPILNSIEKDALSLARLNCVGNYTVGHIDAWKKLKCLRLVKSVKTSTSAYYSLTKKGKYVLGQLERRS